MNRLLVIFLVAYGIGPAAAQKARVDFDHACDFARYRTYRWTGPPESDVLNQLMQERVVGFVEEALSVRGLHRVNSGGDLLLSCRMDAREQEIYTTFTNGMGWGWDFGWGSSISTTTTDTMLIGTLTVDLVDSHRNQLVFQGVSSTQISKKPARNTRKYAKVVNKIFEKYPPR
jgi:hypothetical protein